jgi:hypothetical protein
MDSTGPPEQIGGWGLVYLHPIPMRGADYAHHIALSPPRFFICRRHCSMGKAKRKPEASMKVRVSTGIVETTKKKRETALYCKYYCAMFTCFFSMLFLL